MKPTILFVTEIKPYPFYGGMYIHIYNVLESLCQHFNVLVLAPTVEEECPLLEQIVQWYTLPKYDVSLRAKVMNGLYVLQPRPEWAENLQDILKQHQPAGVWFLYGHWGQYIPLVRQHGAFAIMMTQNIQSELTRQRATITQWGLLYLLTRLRGWAEAYHERSLFRHFDRVISLTEIDRRYHARFIGDERSVLIPGYISAEAYQVKQPVKREHNLLIITGSFNSFQNLQGVCWFMQTVWPQVLAAYPNVCLQLVGKDANQLPAAILQAKQVEAVDTVLDVAPYLWGATISLVPILHGSGIRFKILEALACKIPIVSTSLGAQGIKVAPGESILLADTPDSFAQAIITLLDEPQRRTEMAEKGLAVLQKEYTTSVNTKRIRRLIEELCCQQFSTES